MTYDEQAQMCKDMLDRKGFWRLKHHADNSWRHGCYVADVFVRESDSTYWQADYRLSSDGETNELREGTADIMQVKPLKELSQCSFPLRKTRRFLKVTRALTH